MAKPKQKFWRSVVEVVILSKGPQPPADDDLTPFNIADETTTGGWNGDYKVVSRGELEPREMADALRAHGSEPEFLGLDDAGEILEEEEENVGQE